MYSRKSVHSRMKIKTHNFDLKSSVVRCPLKRKLITSQLYSYPYNSKHLKYFHSNNKLSKMAKLCFLFITAFCVIQVSSKQLRAYIYHLTLILSCIIYSINLIGWNFEIKSNISSFIDIWVDINRKYIF